MARTTVRSEQVKDKSLLIDDLRDFCVEAVSGLDIQVCPGRIRNNNSITDKTAQNLSLTDNTTNYVEIDTAGVASFNTTGFTSGRIPLATVATSSGAITTITDKRSWFVVDNTGAGSTPGTLSGTTKDVWIALARTNIKEDTTATRPANEVGNMRVDTFVDGSGIDDALSVDYTLRGTPNYDIIVTAGSLDLFRPGNIPTNLQGYWRLNEGGNIGNPTPSGNVQIDTAQSVFGGASGLFDGSGDYLTFSNSDNFNFKGNFTFEWRMRPATIGTNQGLFYKGAGSGFSPIRADFDTGTLTIYFSLDGASWAGTVTTTLSASTWYALAVVRSGSTITLYKDGVAVDTTTVSGSLLVTTDSFLIGNYQNTKYYDGHLDELRFSRVARYTADYTPAGSAFVNDADTQLLLHFDGADASTTFTNSCDGTRFDETSNSNDLTDNNTVLISPQDYWRGKGEGSADFEASNSEYLSITDGSQTGLDITGSISFSAFVKIEDATTTNPVLTKWDESLGSQKSFDFGVNSSSQVYFNGSSNGSSEVNINSGSFTVPIGKWVHIACVYDGSFITLYLDGNVVAVTAYSSGLFSSTSPFWIGRQHRSVSAYMDGLIKDGAVWSSALTPLQIKSIALGVDLSSFAYRPSNIATPVSYWKLNEISSGAGAITRNDSVGTNHLTDNNTVTTFGGYIEGAGADFEFANSEYLEITDASQSGLDITGNITISAWVKMESISGGGDSYGIASKYNATGNQRSYLLMLNSAGSDNFQFLVSSDGTSGNTTTVTDPTNRVAGVWYHVVGRLNGTSLKLFVDGTEVASGTHTGGIFNSTSEFNIGRAFNTAGGYFDGLISDVAIWNSALTDAQIASLACGLPLQSQAVTSHWKMNESSGNRADSIGSNTLTDNGSVPGVTGLVGNAADFNGSTQYLTDASARDFACPTDEEWTWFTWHNFDLHATEMYFLNLPDSGNNLSVSKQTTGGGRWDLALGGATFSTTIATTTGAWEHLLITKRGTTWELHVSGYRRNTQAQTGAITASGTLYIGRFNSGILYFDGKMDEMGLAKRGFREEEVKTIYNKGRNAKEFLSTEVSPATSAVVISTAFTVSETPDRALIINNKVTGTGSLTFYVSRVSSPGTNLADTTKWTPITENTITDISGQSSGTSCRWAVELDGDSELDDIAVVFGKATV